MSIVGENSLVDGNDPNKRYWLSQEYLTTLGNNELFFCREWIYGRIGDVWKPTFTLIRKYDPEVKQRTLPFSITKVEMEKQNRDIGDYSSD